MKIETFSVSVAARDGMTRMAISDRIKAAMSGACDCGIYAIELGGADDKAQPKANEEPRKKRKYTRRPKAPQGAEEDAGTAARDGVKVRRIQSKGEVVEMRGNCQGGYAKAEVN